MGISFGSASKKPYVGSKEVQEAYVGSQLVYKGKPNPVTLFDGTVSKSISPELKWMGTRGTVTGTPPRAMLETSVGWDNGYWCNGKFETLNIRHLYSLPKFAIHFYKDGVDMRKTTINVAQGRPTERTINIKALAAEAGIDYNGVGVSGTDVNGITVNFIMLY